MPGAAASMGQGGPSGPDRGRVTISMVDFQDRQSDAFYTSGRALDHGVIDPRDTRPRLISALDMLRNKRDANPVRKHGNIPL